MTARCYHCGAKATTREHVPPKCMFPEGFRHNLITVPSCDRHNLAKTKDDEYLRSVLAVAPGNNTHCLGLLDGKILPSLDRRPHLVGTLFPALQPLQVDGLETAMFTLDRERFERSVVAVARGLFFHEYERRIAGEARVAWGPYLLGEPAEAPFLDIVENAQHRLPPIDRGSNPEVFTYAIDRSTCSATWLCRLRFFQGHPVCIVWHEREASP